MITFPQTATSFGRSRKPHENIHAGSMSDIGLHRSHLLPPPRRVAAAAAAAAADVAVALVRRKRAPRLTSWPAQTVPSKAEAGQKQWWLRGRSSWREASASCRGPCAWAARWSSRTCRVRRRGGKERIGPAMVN